MERRNALRGLAAAVTAIGTTLRTWPAMASVPSTAADRLSAAQLLTIYDPTLDATARPVFLPDSEKENFIPLPEWIHLDRVASADGVIGDMTVDEPHEMPRFRGKDFRPLLNGRIVKGANEASVKGGWVHFLAQRPDEDGKMSPYAHAWRDGHYDRESPGGAVTGIAFGKVEWMIDPAALTRGPDDVEP